MEFYINLKNLSNTQQSPVLLKKLAKFVSLLLNAYSQQDNDLQEEMAIILHKGSTNFPGYEVRFTEHMNSLRLLSDFDIRRINQGLLILFNRERKNYWCVYHLDDDGLFKQDSILISKEIELLERQYASIHHVDEGEAVQTVDDEELWETMIERYNQHCLQDMTVYLDTSIIVDCENLNIYLLGKHSVFPKHPCSDEEAMVVQREPDSFDAPGALTTVRYKTKIELFAEPVRITHYASPQTIQLFLCEIQDLPFMAMYNDDHCDVNQSEKTIETSVVFDDDQSFLLSRDCDQGSSSTHNLPLLANLASQTKSAKKIKPKRPRDEVSKEILTQTHDLHPLMVIPKSDDDTPNILILSKRQLGAGNFGKVSELFGWLEPVEEASFQTRLTNEFVVKKIPRCNRNKALHEFTMAQRYFSAKGRNSLVPEPIFINNNKSGEDAYLVMPRIDGLTLDSYINQSGMRRDARLLSLLTLLLRIAKEVNFFVGNVGLHLDLKENNIMIDSSGQVFLVDLSSICAPGDTSHEYPVVERCPPECWNGIWLVNEYAQDYTPNERMLVYTLGMIFNACLFNNASIPPWILNYYDTNNSHNFGDAFWQLVELDPNKLNRSKKRKLQKLYTWFDMLKDNSDEKIIEKNFGDLSTNRHNSLLHVLLILGLRKIIRKMTAPDPEQRYASLELVCIDLDILRKVIYANGETPLNTWFTLACLSPKSIEIFYRNHQITNYIEAFSLDDLYFYKTTIYLDKQKAPEHDAEQNIELALEFRPANIILQDDNNWFYWLEKNNTFTVDSYTLCELIKLFTKIFVLHYLFKTHPPSAGPVNSWCKGYRNTLFKRANEENPQPLSILDDSAAINQAIETGTLEGCELANAVEEGGIQYYLDTTAVTINYIAP